LFLPLRTCLPFSPYTTLFRSNAEEDRKARELVDARNQCDAMVHSVRKSMSEHGDKLDASEKSQLEEALKAAEEAMKSGDKGAIEDRKSTRLNSSHVKISYAVF